MKRWLFWELWLNIGNIVKDDLQQRRQPESVFGLPFMLAVTLISRVVKTLQTP